MDLPDIAFRELRFAAGKPVTIATVKTSSGSAFRASGGSYTARPGSPSASFYITKEAARLKQVEISWSADPAANGPVSLEIWAKTGAPQTEGRLESAPAPTAPKRAAPITKAAPPQPAEPGVAAAAPPPPPPPAPAPSAARPDSKPPAAA